MLKQDEEKNHDDDLALSQELGGGNHHRGGARDDRDGSHNEGKGKRNGRVDQGKSLLEGRTGKGGHGEAVFRAIAHRTARNPILTLALIMGFGVVWILGFLRFQYDRNLSRNWCPVSERPCLPANASANETQFQR